MVVCVVQGRECCVITGRNVEKQEWAGCVGAQMQRACQGIVLGRQALLTRISCTPAACACTHHEVAAVVVNCVLL